MAKFSTYIFFLILGLISNEVFAGQDPGNGSDIFAGQSVLKEGNWYKFKTSREGVHKITYDDLVSAGIDPAGIDPSTIQLFGNYNGMVPEENKRSRQDDLVENSIIVAGAQDASFDKEDYILFYANSPLEWKINPFLRIFMHTINLYDDGVYFFLRFNQEEGKRIGNHINPGVNPSYQRKSYSYYEAHQEELYSLTKSGQEWFGEHITDGLPHTFTFDVPDADISAEAMLRMRVAARSLGDCELEVIHDGEVIEKIELEKVNFTGVEYATIYSKYINFMPASDQVDIVLKLIPFDGQSQIWVDFLELNMRRNLTFRGEQFSFSDWSATGNGKKTEFILTDHTGNAIIWDVTNPFNVQKIEAEVASDSLRFIVETDTLRKFMVWQDQDVFSPEFVEKVPNQNLHATDAVDYVIVAHPLFIDEAMELASLHEQYDGLSSVVVTTEEIYNEFGGGKQDVAAIRDFVRMLYLRGGADKPRYLLLYGDASYDPKDREGEHHNFIPAYESRQSVYMTKSFVTDDFYGLMDESEGEDAQGSLDIGVGRFPVSNTEQAQVVLSKVKHYIQKKSQIYGQWRNKVVFVADDEDNNAHFDQAEGLTRIVEEESPQYLLRKIYLDAYPQESLPGGKRFPQVNDAINEAVKNGSLFVNYTGHGGELGWADEKILGIPMINNWSNLDNLPIFMTATCEFSRFDNPEFISGGELVLLNPNGGGVALFTTSRLSYSQTNYGLNKDFYRSCFTPINGEMPRLGDLVRLSKQSSNSGVYTKNFVLLGDPALQPAYPKYSIETEDMVIDGSDTLTTAKAMSVVNIKGVVKDFSGERNSEFNGIIYSKVYDKKTKYTTLGNDQSSKPATFHAETKLLSEGRAGVKDGEFEFTFVVPRDIEYEFGEGSIYFYAVDTSAYQDANGIHTYTIGGINENAIADNEGPQINAYLNTPSFVSGDVVDENPVLFVDLQDISGINSTGNGIGHNIVATIDGRTEESVILNEHYTPALNDHTSGSIIYPLSELAPGKHTIQLKAWDMFNNSGIQLIEFTIEKDLSVSVDAVKNYPNPFAQETTFEINHQKLTNETDVELLVFDTYGKLVERMKAGIDPSAGTVTQLVWNGQDQFGKKLNNGVYVYHLIFSNDYGYKSKKSGKLIIVN